MEGYVRDKFEETGKGGLKTDWKRHGRMLWRQVGEDVKGCRRQIGETWKEALQTFDGDTRRHWKGIQGDTLNETRGRRNVDTL